LHTGSVNTVQRRHMSAPEADPVFESLILTLKAVELPTAQSIIADHSAPERQPSDVRQMTLVSDNPHCAQILTPLVRPYFSRADDLAPRPLNELPVRIDADSPRIPYATRRPEDRSPLHWGQAKLWASEVQLLTQYTRACAGEAYSVVYAGAAPGHHIPSLARLFPSCTFHLYDPVRFCPELRRETSAHSSLRGVRLGNVRNVRLYNEFFTEEVATEISQRLAGQALVFISDIRTGKEEDYVEVDMVRQAGWARTIRAQVSMLKFRLPWGEGKTPYLAGDVMLPVYAPLTSTECRLVSTQAHIAGPDVAYDNLEYERACAYQNAVGRVHTYEHGVVGVPGLDHCYDCSKFVLVARDYLRAVGRPTSPDSVRDLINEVVTSFGMGRNLATASAKSSSERPQGVTRHYEGDVLRVAPVSRRGVTRGGRGGRAPVTQSPLHD
jgi:hypothetical protein